MTALRRNRLVDLLSAVNLATVHPGLWLMRGLADYPQKGGDNGNAGGGGAKAEHIKKMCQFKPSEVYKAAFERWKRMTQDPQRFRNFQGTLEGRLYVGVTRDNALETGVTVSHTYGMPMIPGSAVKGACRAAALHWEMNQATLRWIFGHDAKDKDDPEQGGLVFHDAWWVAEDHPPFVSEIVTVHHQEYYGSEGVDPPTDFDSPIPAPQVAVRGSFYFVVEGSPVMAEAVTGLLKTVLTTRGIGAKRSSGYGFFSGS